LERLNWDDSLIGLKFGKLIIIKLIFIKNKHNYFKCKCDCGNEKIIRKDHIKSGKIKSCGCLRIELSKKRTLKHGHLSGYKMSRTYAAWRSAKKRCLDSKNINYKDYGGRGIKICKRWMKFENFFKDVGEIPKGLTLDRINNNKGYSPSNFRLITQKEQCCNKRNNRLFTYNNKTQCISKWAEEYNISYQKLYRRIFRDKWTIERALENT